MDAFFKVDHVVVDVEAGKIFDASGSVMIVDFTNMTVKDFKTRSKLTPIRFNDNKELMMWQAGRDKWTLMSDLYHDRLIKAINGLIERKIEKEFFE